MWIWATYLSVIPPKKTERYNLALIVLRVALSIHKHNYTSGAGTAHPSAAPGFPAELWLPPLVSSNSCSNIQI